MVSFYNVSFNGRIADIPTQKEITLEKCNLSGYTAFLNAKVYQKNNTFENADLLFKDGELIAVNSCDDEIKEANVVDAKGKYITPSILEQHIHGGAGCDFNTADEEEMHTLLKELKNSGCAELLATLITDSIQNINKQIVLINKIIQNPNKDEAKIIGINLEGPFLSKKKKGIHNEGFIIPPSIETYNEIPSENVKMVTVAPELDKDYELIKYLNQKDVITSAGHSTASASDIKDSNVKQITHLFNAMPSIESRKDGILKEALINDNVTVEIIPDLNHLTADTLNLTLKVKPEDKVVFVSDALSESHTNKNSFEMNGIEVTRNPDGFAEHIEYDNGKPVSTIAGSLSFLSDSAKKIVEKANIDFEKFIRFACVNPANNLNRTEYFTLEEGTTPNFTIWDKETLKPEKTFVANA